MWVMRDNLKKMSQDLRLSIAPNNFKEDAYQENIYYAIYR